MIEHFISSLDPTATEKYTESHADYEWTGNYNIAVSSKCTYYNGATYTTGRMDLGNGYSPYIFRWEDDVLEYKAVATLTATDPLGHPHPALLIIGGYIYVFQTQDHGDKIKIWKSNATDDIASGFTLHHTTTDDFYYCNPRLLSDNRVVILARELDYSQMMAISDVSDYTTWTTVNLTVEDHTVNDIWHYPSHPLTYGTNSWHYFGISLRDNSLGAGNEVTFGHAIYKTQDFSTYYSLDEGFSKNVVSSGAFTRSEIETNLMVIGSNTASTTWQPPLYFVVINDTIYGRYYDHVTDNYFRFYKIDSSGTQTDYTCALPNISTTHDESMKISVYSNGSNLIFISYDTVKTAAYVYTTDLNFANTEEREQVVYTGETNPASALVLPDNLQDVTGLYAIMGGNSGGYMSYLLTDNTFTI